MKVNSVTTTDLLLVERSLGTGEVTENCNRIAPHQRQRYLFMDHPQIRYGDGPRLP